MFRVFLVSLVCGLNAAIIIGCSQPQDTADRAQVEESAAPRPNVILISVDTLRKDHLSTYGYEKPTSPNITELAADGVKFESAYAPMPVTGPSHTTMLTGLYPITHRVERNGAALTDEFTTITEYLRDEGYQTHAVVSSFVLDAKFGLIQGFDSYEDDFPIPGATMGLRRFKGHELEENAGFDQQANHASDKAIEVLNRLDPKDKPFFIFIHYMDPHRPYVPPEPYKSEFAAESEDPNVLEYAIGEYDAEIAFTDDQIGRLLRRLDELGLRDNTLIVLTADHGEGLMDHGLLGHGFTLYENEVNVPLIVSWPAALPKGETIIEPVELVDIAPTILDLIGATPETVSFSGVSLKDALLGTARLAAKREVYLHRRWYNGDPNEEGENFEPFHAFRNPPDKTFAMKGRKYGIRHGVWKFIQAGEDGVDEIYNLEADPGEKRNLADAQSDRVVTLEGTIQEWLSRYKLEPGEAVPELSQEDVEGLRALGYVQ